MTKTNTVKSEDRTPYVVDATTSDELTERDMEDELIADAQHIIKRRLSREGTKVLTRPAETGQYLQVLLGANEHEIFGVLMLDNRNRAMAWREMFRGTVDGASVYPREVVKQALADNAAAVILCHNHPSGNPEPSQADIRITERLKAALALVDIRVLDHVIIGEKLTYLSELGHV